jgi:hypothetical protein
VLVEREMPEIQRTKDDRRKAEIRSDNIRMYYEK